MYHTKKRQRKGNIIVLSAVLMSVMLGVVALSVDIGYLYVTRTELQATADAAALAGVAKLYPLSDDLQMNTFYLEPDINGSRSEAQTFARYNGAGLLRGQGPGDHSSSAKTFTLNANWENTPGGDIVIGRINDPSIRSEPLVPTLTFPNTVQATARLRDGHTNGAVNLFFARIFGIDNGDVHATASASVIHASLLPFATSTDKWNSLATGGDGDNYAVDHGVTGGPDNIPEITIFPDQNWNGEGLPPGNFGALSIGTDTASAADLRRQIDRGPTADELAFHAPLGHGVVMSGKTGMNATVKTAFKGGNADGRTYEGIIGHPRFLPIYSNVGGNGTNSWFEIAGFVAVRVMHVDLTGKTKFVTLQPIIDTRHLMSIRLTR
jgi:hypothetical protein